MDDDVDPDDPLDHLGRQCSQCGHPEPGHFPWCCVHPNHQP